MNTQEAQRIYFDWLAKPRRERYPLTKTEMAKKLGVVEGTLRNWQKAVKSTEADELARQIREMDAAVYEAGKKNSQMAKLWYQRMGVLTDKPTEKPEELSAAEIDRISREAEARVNRAINRVESVPEER